MVRSKKYRVLIACFLAAALLLSVQLLASAATLKYGQSGSAVKTLQKNLQALGFYSDKADGKYDKAVRTSVGTFQIANDLIGAEGVKLGVADELTQAVLKSGEAVSYEEYENTLKDQMLVPGGTGSYVKSLQKQLKKLGYYTAAVNSKYDQATEDAVSYFQTANGLYPSGIANRETRQALNGSGAVTREAYEAANHLISLKSGSKGAQVTYFQNQLIALGYLEGAASGTYDKNTLYAVNFFQEANNLTVTGAADRLTRAAANAGGVPYETYAATQALVPVAKNDKGVAVAMVERRLTELGYYSAAIDGAFDAKVESAVEKFQTFNNVAASGKADVATRQLMNAQAALTYAQVNGPDTLRKGDKGNEVKVLQSQLCKQVQYYDAIDGKYDDGVVAAVKKFQKAHGLSVTGIAYSNTRALLQSVSSVNFENYRVEALIEIAESKLGCAYSTKARKGPNSFDCSGFTSYCFGKVGVSLSGEVSAQGRKTKGLKITNMKELQRGDLVFFDTQEGKSPGHAAIYLGKSKGKPQFIHSSSAKGKVMVS